MDDRFSVTGLPAVGYALAAASQSKDQETKAIYLSVARVELRRVSEEVERHRAQLDAYERELARVNGLEAQK